MRHHIVLRGRIGSGEKLIDERIAGIARAGTGPLTVGGVRRAPGIHRERRIGDVRADGAQRIRMVGRAAVTRTIHQIDFVALLHIIMRPSGHAVAEAHVVQHLASAAMYQNHRVRAAHLGRDQILHIHLPAQDGAIWHCLVFRTDPEEAVIGQLHGGLARLHSRSGYAFFHVLGDPREDRL